MPSSESSVYRRSVFLMLLSVALFAVNVLAIRWLSLHATAVDGWLASLFRGGVGIALVAILYSRGRGLQWRNLIGRPLVAFRGILGAGSIVAFYITVVELGAARATVLNLTYPMFGAMIAAIWLREHLSWHTIGSLAAGFAGLMIFLSDETFDTGISGYDLLALGGALAAGAVIVIIRQLRHAEHPSTIYASQCVYGLAVAVIPSVETAAALTPIPMLVLAGTGVVVAFGQLFMTEAYQTIPVSQGGAIQMLLPLVTAAGGFAFFGERFSPVELTGAAITLVATWRIVRGRRRILAPGSPPGT